MVRLAETAWLAVPEPIAWLAVLVKLARFASVPHSNQASVACPLGLTLPLNVAAEVVMEVAPKVCVVGGALGVPVVKLVMLPLFAPALEEAQAR